MNENKEFNIQQREGREMKDKKRHKTLRTHTHTHDNTAYCIMMFL